MKLNRLHLAGIAVSLVIPSLTQAQGRIVVANDEWTLSDSGWTASAPDFARNVGTWFTAGAPGNFLVRSWNFGLLGNQLRQLMEANGHTWTIDLHAPATVASLLQYDAIFLAGDVLNNTVLIEYVNAGGCVYIAAGTSDANTDDFTWDPFLQAFGLRLESLNSFGGVFPIASQHPLMLGVTGLYQLIGNSVTDLEPANPANQVLASYAGQGLYAVYDGALAVSAYCTAKTNSLGCVPSIGSSGYPSVASGLPFVVSATAVLNARAGILMYGATAAAVPFQGGVKCVAAPVQRSPFQIAGGTPLPANDCSGAYAFDFNAWIAAGSDPALVLGQQVHCQYWSRDPQSPSGTGLTNALRFVIGG